VTRGPGSVRLDLNNAEFQQQFFSLQKADALSVFASLRKLSQMSWQQIYNDSGLRWEAIASKAGPAGGRLYSLRLGKGFRAVAYRQDDWLRILSLHPDHDSAYD
jgi:hypothetical protein